MMAMESLSAPTELNRTRQPLALAELVLDGPAGRFRLDHRYVRVEAERIASDGFAGTIHVTREDDRLVVVSGAHTVLALRHLVRYDRAAWDRLEQSFRPAKDLYEQVNCLVGN